MHETPECPCQPDITAIGENLECTRNMTKIKVAQGITWRIGNLDSRVCRLRDFVSSVKNHREHLLIMDDDLELHYDPRNSLDTVLVDWDTKTKHHTKVLSVELIMKTIKSILSQYGKCDKCSKTLGSRCLMYEFKSYYNISLCASCVEELQNESQGI